MMGSHTDNNLLSDQCSDRFNDSNKNSQFGDEKSNEDCS